MTTELREIDVSDLRTDPLVEQVELILATNAGTQTAIPSLETLSASGLLATRSISALAPLSNGTIERTGLDRVPAYPLRRSFRRVKSPGNSVDLQGMRSIILILVAALPIVLSESAIAGEIYKWTDANGRVHFGDRPASANAEKVERPTEGTNPIASLRSFDRCQAYMRTREFKAWTIEKRMDYNAKCMQMYEQNLIDKVETADRKIERERQRKIRQIDADRYAATESKRLNRPQESNSDWNSIEPNGRFGRPNEGDPARWSDESYCQGKYGRSCSDLATWKTKALESCKRKNPSGGCGAASIQKSKPVTLEEQKARRAARAARNQQKTRDYQDQQQRTRR